MTSSIHLNNYDLLSRIMGDLNDFIDKRGNRALLPALIMVKEQRDEVVRLREIVSELTEHEKEFGPYDESTWTHHPGETHFCVHGADAEQCPSCACRTDQGLPTGTETIHEQVGKAVSQHYRQYSVDATVKGVERTGPGTFTVHIGARDVKPVAPAPNHTPACRAGEIDAECPCETHQTKLSTSFNNPPIQLRWEIEGIAAIEVEQTMLAHRYNIASIYVDPEYQNLGIGTALMNIVLHEADMVGIELWLVPTAMPGKQKALNDFYMRFGFEGLKGSGYMIRKSPKTEPEQ